MMVGWFILRRKVERRDGKDGRMLERRDGKDGSMVEIT